jgi:diacylglycerol kinase (ATP)
LSQFYEVPNPRIIACGGDGTVGWVLNAMDSLYESNETRPPVGVIPLGTGLHF